MELTKKDFALMSMKMYKWQKRTGRVAMFKPKSYAIACIKNQSYF